MSISILDFGAFYGHGSVFFLAKRAGLIFCVKNLKAYYWKDGKMQTEKQ